VCVEQANIEGGESVIVEVDFDKVELMDNKEDGVMMGDVRFILYKGDHYHLTIRTENGDNLYVDTHDVWDDRDIVGIKIQPEDIRIKRV
jgi:spermidine/putrescine transport system ATP-binding protein